MLGDLEECVDILDTIKGDLNCAKSPCCKEKARFHLWDNEDEARLHLRTTSAAKKVRDILIDFRKVSDKRKGVDK
tara:strand:+ start:4438 stop:4662 length:225 start_codon:yes stop_codon:yes gene_type:complete